MKKRKPKMVTVTVRDSVARFALIMEEKLSGADHKPHWSRLPYGYLLSRLLDELSELNIAVSYGYTPVLIARECADVANFAMMIADNLRLKMKHL